MERQSEKNMNPPVITIMAHSSFFSLKSHLIRRMEQEKIPNNLET